MTAADIGGRGPRYQGGRSAIPLLGERSGHGVANTSSLTPSGVRRRRHLLYHSVAFAWSAEETEALPKWTSMAMLRHRTPKHREQSQQLGFIGRRHRRRGGDYSRCMEARTRARSAPQQGRDATCRGRGKCWQANGKGRAASSSTTRARNYDRPSTFPQYSRGGEGFVPTL